MNKEIPGGEHTAFFKADNSSNVKPHSTLISTHKPSFLSLGRFPYWICPTNLSLPD